ncbi:geranylgeranyl reductase family [Dehalogenimonas formicexedens]|uniref:Geranylgeranyl reductase family n=1 Tax=Dehalogenimonas formicexedens TaxID=1839801 RepID=A0A1P8F9L1_9CHLR|nr:NAD(P)/FAD-dependent oxidoreductase [Dehalogenimonas formicexedens]APV45133.1 geranylgeranyl reductase family [Dehalogenimonas formicexedens]
MSETDADIIVIGAGPAGSRVARQLALQGHDVILLEKRQTLGEPVCCTGIVSTQCVAEFSIDPDLIMHRFSGALIHSPSGEIVPIRRSTIQAVAIDRAAFDRRMTEKAQAAGARLMLGTTANYLDIQPDRVVVAVFRNQEQRHLTARAVVVAAGLTQKLTPQLGLVTIKDFAVGVQLDVEGADVSEIEIFSGKSLAPGFFAWLVPTSPGHAKLGMIVRHQPMASILRLISLLATKRRGFVPAGKPVCRPIPLNHLRKSYTDRLLVVGDAAGQVKTTTGGGLYYGLLCADIAASTLHQGLLGDRLRSTDLKCYERAWLDRLGREMLVGRLARNVFRHLGDHQLDGLMRRTQESGLMAKLLVDDRLSFDWHSPAILRLVTGLFRR